MLDHVARDFFLKLLYEEGALRPWPYQAHIAFQHIEKLRHLVNARLSDEFSYCGDAGISRRRPLALFLGWRLYLHGTELVHLKGLIMESYSLLAENHRSLRGELNGYHRYKHHRREQHNGHQRSEDVYHPLHRSVCKACQRHMPDMDDRKTLQILHIGECGDHVVVIGNKLRVHS